MPTFISAIEQIRQSLESTDFFVVDNPDQQQTYKISGDVLLTTISRIAQEAVLKPTSQNIDLTNQDFTVDSDTASIVFFNVTAPGLRVILPNPTDLYPVGFNFFVTENSIDLVYNSNVIVNIPPQNSVKIRASESAWWVEPVIAHTVIPL